MSFSFSTLGINSPILLTFPINCFNIHVRESIANADNLDIQMNSVLEFHGPRRTRRRKYTRGQKIYYYYSILPSFTFNIFNLFTCAFGFVKDTQMSKSLASPVITPLKNPAQSRRPESLRNRFFRGV